MRFRRLTLEELKPLEKDFVYFLASNSVEAKDWVKLKEEQSPRVDELIEEFSDFVLFNSLQKIEYVEQTQKNSLLLFHFKKEELEIISIAGEGKNQEETWLEFLKANPKNNIVVTNATYTESREDMLFGILDKGGFIIDESFYSQIKNFTA